MPATEFICPDGKQVPIEDCLNHCPHGDRCMFLPTLRAVAQSLNRNIAEPTVTELISGVRETYLKKTQDYAIEPSSALYAIQGQAFHLINEANSEGIISEVRLKDSITSGKFDLFGKLLDETDGTLGDLKVTSSYKLMRALGIYKVDVPTGEVYKTGSRKGQPKFRKEFRYDGIRDTFDWSVQLNYYRMLLEKEGYEVKRMVVQAICRDSNLRTASERGITKPVYLIEINRLSDHWLEEYFHRKALALNSALLNHKLPPVCNPKERWSDKKCQSYCAARQKCPYAQALVSKDKYETVDF